MTKSFELGDFQALQFKLASFHRAAPLFTLFFLQELPTEEDEAILIFYTKKVSAHY